MKRPYGLEPKISGVEEELYDDLETVDAHSDILVPEEVRHKAPSVASDDLVSESDGGGDGGDRGDGGGGVGGGGGDDGASDLASDRSSNVSASVSASASASTSGGGVRRRTASGKSSASSPSTSSMSLQSAAADSFTNRSTKSMKSTRSSRRKSYTKSGLLSSAVENDYAAFFLSHKKVHSTAGAVPAQIAKNFHDSLELLGYKGWFDVDELKEISKPALRKGIEHCKSMIILINDETAESEWCRYEWEVALEIGLPCKVVVDLERCAKKSRQVVLNEMLSTFPHLCAFQWVDFTEKYRRDALEELCEFLHDLEESIIDSQSESENGSDSGVDVERPAPLLQSKSGLLKRDDRHLRKGTHGPVGLTYGKGKNRHQLLSTIFQRMCLFGGIPAYTPKGVWQDISKWWRWILQTMYVMVFGLSISGKFVASTSGGPYYGTLLSMVPFNAFLVTLFFNPMIIRNIFSSKDFSAMLRRMDQTTTSHEFAETVYRHSQLISYGVAALGFGTGVILLMAFMPLIWHPYYTEHEDLWPRMWSSLMGYASPTDSRAWTVAVGESV
mmetsp:Transcript_104011/g.299559  ORF Transcript_104011/g.299559 Transcript_104011/m.299559 type:complete len:557 (+) Transcript_104011:193-1863(+)